MSKPNLSPLALAAGLLLAACSDAPAPEASRSPDSPTRQIELAVPAPIDSSVASDLEVGRSTKVPVRRVAALRAVESPKAAPAPLGELAAPVTRVSLPAVVSTEVLQPVAVPTAPAPAEAPPSAGGLGSGRERMIHAMSQGDGLGMEPGSTGGGPTIMIRGGMGGVHDKCDLRPRGFAGGGIAINRLAPGLGSYGRGPQRGGIR